MTGFSREADSTMAVALPVDSITADTAAADTIPLPEPVWGLLLEAPEKPVVEEVTDTSWDVSYIILGIILLFCIIGFRFRNNSKYVGALFQNLVGTRLRSNAFDDTVRETSFLVLLNVLWSCVAGIALYNLLILTGDSAPALTERPALCMGVCMGVMACYTCFMSLAYLIVGSVFSDGVHARMWLKGYAASQGLLCVVWVPLALMLLTEPSWHEGLLLTMGITLIMTECVFIWKGLRIFFTQISSWVLFLYYLCSLEIVPLILTYWAARGLSDLL